VLHPRLRQGLIKAAPLGGERAGPASPRSLASTGPRMSCPRHVGDRQCLSTVVKLTSLVIVKSLERFTSSHHHRWFRPWRGGVLLTHSNTRPRPSSTGVAPGLVSPSSTRRPRRRGRDFPCRRSTRHRDVPSWQLSSWLAQSVEAPITPGRTSNAARGLPSCRAR